MLKKLKWRLNFNREKKEWRKRNAHNSTEILNDFDMDSVSVGKGTYGGLKVFTYGAGAELQIGNYCSIAPEVSFMLTTEHHLKTMSTYPFKAKIMHSGKQEATSKGDIVIGDDVWIGYGATIMSGVTIGQGAVIATRALVTKDVPPYAVVGGVPAKLLSYRFDEGIRAELVKIDYSKLTDEKIKENIDKLYTTLTSVEDAKNLKKSLEL